MIGSWYGKQDLTGEKVDFGMRKEQYIFGKQIRKEKEKKKEKSMYESRKIGYKQSLQ